jgi:hypothetical protein
MFLGLIWLAFGALMGVGMTQVWFTMKNPTSDIPAIFGYVLGAILIPMAARGAWLMYSGAAANIEPVDRFFLVITPSWIAASGATIVIIARLWGRTRQIG